MVKYRNIICIIFLVLIAGGSFFAGRFYYNPASDNIFQLLASPSKHTYKLMLYLKKGSTLQKISVYYAVAESDNPDYAFLAKRYLSEKSSSVRKIYFYAVKNNNDKENQNKFYSTILGKEKDEILINLIKNEIEESNVMDEKYFTDYLRF